MNDSSTTSKSDTPLSFGLANQAKIMRRLTPRIIIYPIVILAIAYFMTKHRQQIESNDSDSGTMKVIQLDTAKPTVLSSADSPAPFFPQLVIYHENNLPDPAIAINLRDKYSKFCTIVDVDMTKAPNLKAKYADQKTPFAILSKPDGTVLTIQDKVDTEFFSQILESLKDSPADKSDAKDIK